MRADLACPIARDRCVGLALSISDIILSRITGAFLLYSVLDSVDVYAVKGDLIAQLYGLLDQLLVDPENAEVRVLAVRFVHGLHAPLLRADLAQDIGYPRAVPRRRRQGGDGACTGPSANEWRLTDQQAHFQTLLPKMLQVIGQAVESGDDSVARQLFDTLETLLILVSWRAHTSSIR